MVSAFKNDGVMNSINRIPIKTRTILGAREVIAVPAFGGRLLWSDVSAEDAQFPPSSGNCAET